MLAIAGALAPVLAPAQQTPRTPQEIVDEGLRRQAERDRAQQDSLAPHADNLRAAPAGARLPDLPDEKPCFVVSEIVFLGPDVQRFHWLQSSTLPFLNRCVGVQGLARIAGYLDAQLIEQGYVTSRVALAEQNLAGGRLEFRLHAGRIAKIRMVRAGAANEPASKAAQSTPQDDPAWGTWRNAFPIHEGGLLDARDLEQGVEQMKRLPSQGVVTTLTPGDAPDTSVVTIERQSGTLAERVHGGVTIDNSGSPSLGRTQLAANLAFDGPLGLSDLITLGLNSNAESPDPDHRSQSWNAGYSVPFGYATLSLNASHSRFTQNVQLTTVQALSSGQSDTAELKWQQVLWRTAATKTGLHASLSTRRSSSFLNDVELVVQHRKTTFLETGASFKQLFDGGASIDVDASYRRGVPWMSAQEDLPINPGAPEAALTLRPRIWTLNVNTAVPFKLGQRAWQYSTNLRAQFTGDRTTSIDQIAIGNRATVRGFDGDAVLLAESGWVLRNELSLPWQANEAFQGAAYVGLDAGRVWGQSDLTLVGHALAGAALGVRGQWRAFQFDFALASPLHVPEGFKTSRTNLYASLTYAF